MLRSYLFRFGKIMKDTNRDRCSSLLSIMKIFCKTMKPQMARISVKQNTANTCRQSQQQIACFHLPVQLKEKFARALLFTWPVFLLLVSSFLFCCFSFEFLWIEKPEWKLRHTKSECKKKREKKAHQSYDGCFIVVK